VTCVGGRVAPSADTERKLFAHSAGRCQNPNCLRYLFFDGDESPKTIAEMAHVIAASKVGPRGEAGHSPESLATFENLVLVCASCHTQIDKAPKSYPALTVFDWKSTHDAKVAAAFDIPTYSSRSQLAVPIHQLLRENRVVHQQYGPDNPINLDPDSELPVIWRRKVRSIVIPNSRTILQLTDRNVTLLSVRESDLLEKFRQHLDDLVARHILGHIEGGGSRFPTDMESILLESA
jgi:hypothetical protein